MLPAAAGPAGPAITRRWRNGEAACSARTRSTGSIGVVTINMPRLGYLSADEGEFLQRLGELMEVAKTSLEIKRKVLERFTELNLYPYTKHYLRGIRERFGQYWRNHFSTIGLVGLNEASVNLLGANVGTRKLPALRAARAGLHAGKARRVSGRDRAITTTSKRPRHKGTSYRLARLDAEKFPGIKSGNETEGKPFYTNSSQLPVQYSDDLFEVLDLQDELQTKYTGGTVVHLFVGEEITDPKNVRQLVKLICERYHLPYFTVTPTFSVCPTHGYLSGKQETCPTCGSPAEVYSQGGGVPAPGEPVERGKGGGVQGAEDLQAVMTRAVA